MALWVMKSAKLVRLLIISIGLTRVPTKNRKTVSYTDKISHNGISYKINGSKTLGVYLQLIHKAIEQLEICESKWGRVFVMRFCLLYTSPSPRDS